MSDDCNIPPPPAPAIEAEVPAAPTAGACNLVAPPTMQAAEFSNDEQTAEAQCVSGLDGSPVTGVVARRVIWHPLSKDDANAIALELAEGRARAGLTCTPPQLAAQVRRLDMVYHTPPHGIRAVGEWPGRWTVLFSGLVANDFYQFEVQYDNAAVVIHSFQAAGTTHTFEGTYPAGATRLVRVEFGIYLLPVSVEGRAYYGWGARSGTEDFYDVLRVLNQNPS